MLPGFRGGSKHRDRCGINFQLFIYFSRSLFAERIFCKKTFADVEFLSYSLAPDRIEHAAAKKLRPWISSLVFFNESLRRSGCLDRPVEAHE